MKQRELTLRDESIIPWLMEYALDPKFKRRNEGECLSPAYVLKDEILITQNCGLGKGDSIKFIFKEAANQSGRPLITTYMYEVVAYDDYSQKLVRRNTYTRELGNKMGDAES